MKVEAFRRMHFRSGKFSRFNIRHGKNVEIKEKKERKPKGWVNPDPRYKDL